jgi:hypothetical protein
LGANGQVGDFHRESALPVLHCGSHPSLNVLSKLIKRIELFIEHALEVVG